VANVQKTIQYTMKDTSTYLQTVVIQPTVLVLHSLTNDLKKKNPQQCVNDLFELVTTILERRGGGGMSKAIWMALLIFPASREIPLSFR
jgi:hypothetical protein